MHPTKSLALILLLCLLSSKSVGQSPPTTGYASIHGLNIYYEIHGKGQPIVLLHGAFMAISGDWNDWIAELSQSRQVIAIEMQGHGRTADISRQPTYENLADDVASLLDFLHVQSTDLLGYSLGGGVAIQCAIRHPDKVRNVVCISAPLRRDGWLQQANEVWPNLTSEVFYGTPIESEYQRLNPTPEKFPQFFDHLKTLAIEPYDFGSDQLKATKAPMLFIFGDADGMRLEHIAEMYRLKGGDVHGDMQTRPASRLAIIPNTTHITLMSRLPSIAPMINDFLETNP